MWSRPSQGLSLLNIIILAVRQTIYIQQKKPQRKEEARLHTNVHAHTNTHAHNSLGNKGEENKDSVGHRVYRAWGL